MSNERILVAGAPGTGKTYQWLTIARLFPNNTFHVIDPDDGVIRVWKAIDQEGHAIFSDVNNLNYYFTPSWFGSLSEIEFGKTGGVANALTDIKKRAKKGDWVVVEMLSNIWQLSQSGFVSEIFQEGIGEYFLEARRKTKEGASKVDALKGWTDWLVINKLHNDDFMIPICYQLPCHVYMTTTASVTTGGEVTKEEADIRSFYGDSLIRLDGQKHNPYRAQTIFLFRREQKRGEEPNWYFSTFIKDRGRQFINNEQLFDFGLQYIASVTGLV